MIVQVEKSNFGHFTGISKGDVYVYIIHIRVSIQGRRLFLDNAIYRAPAHVHASGTRDTHLIADRSRSS